MKTYVEMGLTSLLAVLIYERPSFLVKSANTTLGKIIMIIIVGLLAKQYGINSGILAAIIMIMLQDSLNEGFDGFYGKGSKDTGCATCKKNGGKDKPCTCKSICSGKCNHECPSCVKEGFDNLEPANYSVSGTDQIGLSRQLQINSLNAKMASSQQANGCTNNGGGVAN